MKRIIMPFILAVLAALSVRAAIVFDDPYQFGQPGDTLVFTGVLSNDGSATVFLNSDYVNLLGNSFALNDLFFNNVPFSLDPGQSSSDIELFDFTLNNPFTDSSGTYPGIYNLLGGVNSDVQDMLAFTNFSITETSPVPEPASIILLASALAALVVVRHTWRGPPGLLCRESSRHLGPPSSPLLSSALDKHRVLIP